MSNYVVTGASRGIGLELVRQLAKLPREQARSIICITRSETNASLEQLINESSDRIVSVMIKDITDEKCVGKALSLIEDACSGSGIDVLVNNAGIMYNTDGTMESVSTAQLQEVFRVNVGGAQAMTSALLPLLKRGREKKVINISSTLGSISLAKHTAFAPTHAYKISKAALNMLTAQYAVDFEKEGFTFLAISPGWLKTDLGSQDADLETSIGVNSVKRWILEANRSHNGKFVDICVPGWTSASDVNKYKGEEIPW